MYLRDGSGTRNGESWYQPKCTDVTKDWYWTIWSSTDQYYLFTLFRVIPGGTGQYTASIVPV